MVHSHLFVTKNNNAEGVKVQRQNIDIGGTIDGAERDQPSRLAGEEMIGIAVGWQNSPATLLWSVRRGNDHPRLDGTAFAGPGVPAEPAFWLRLS